MMLGAFRQSLLFGGLLLAMGVPMVFRDAGRAFFFELQAPLWWTSSYAVDALGFLSQKVRSQSALIQEGQRLARINTLYHLSVQQNAFLAQSVKRLEKLLDLPEQAGFEGLLARVMHAEFTPKHHKLLLRRGSLSGVCVGAGVLGSCGVVGRISQVHLYTAEVELISSPGFRMAAEVQGDLYPVLFSGKSMAAGQDPEGWVQHLPLDSCLDQEAILVTSSLGTVFPPGLHLGSLGPSVQKGLFKEAQVLLDPNLFRLREVCILLPKKDPL